ncbi:MAG: ATP-binding protein [Pseudomonadota bacterium]
MGLRPQLLLVSLLLLSLPWAGCEYIRETEATLRQGQLLATRATAQAIANALTKNEELVYPIGTRKGSSNPALHWPLGAAEAPLFSDGYATDWRELTTGVLSADDALVTVRAASWDRRLFLLITVNDLSRHYRTPYTPSDRVELSCVDEMGVLNRLAVNAEAPGPVRTRIIGYNHAAGNDFFRGAWRETEGGYTLELQGPLGPACARLGLRVIDAQGSREQLLFDLRSLFQQEYPWLIYQVPELQAWLEAFSQPGRVVRVTDRSGATVGRVRTPLQDASSPDEQVFWMLRWIFRAALPDPQRQRAETENVADSGAAIQAGYDPASRIVSATASIGHSGDALGTVTVSDPTERYLALTDRATSRLLGLGAFVLATAYLGLFAYASILSWRIRRLGLAAQRVADDQLAPQAFPRSGFNDEVGELSRSYADLLSQIGDYNQYLRSLASTLSHELRTPIAIIGSSLEHLGSKPATPARDEYLCRAKEGLDRLARIVGAMSEASRIEDSLRSSDFEDVEFTALLQSLVGAYRTSFTDHKFTLELPAESRGTGMAVRGNGDLLAQAVDKLVENAVSFAPRATSIILALKLDTLAPSETGRGTIPGRDALCLQVSNTGPTLPDALRARLFEPMVTLRPMASDDSHLGLGLHVARTITESHGGELAARNRDDGSGVVLLLTLPLSAASELEASKSCG